MTNVNRQYNEAHKFSHFRMRDSNGNVAANSGATVAYAVNGDKLFCAAAYCGPRDNFTYSLGRIKSSARLTNFLNHPEKRDGNIYFSYNIENGDVAAAVRAIRDYMVDGLGYSPRYEQKA